MERDVLQRALEQGERLGGMFWPAGVDEPAPGVIEWSHEEGAQVELIGSLQRGHGWPRELGSERVTIHGVVNGRQISLLDTWVSRMNLGGIPLGLYSPTAVVGHYCTNESLWARAMLVTANLSEWRRDTGIKPSFSHSRRAKYVVHLRWKVPTPDLVQLNGTELRFEGGMTSTGLSYAPDWTINTWQQVAVSPPQPLLLADVYRRYAGPLLSFTTFVSDRPDALTDEVLIDQARQRVAVLRQRSLGVEPRLWRPDHAYLFPVEVLDDYGRAISRWWKLHELVWPALGMFADHINHDASYSPSRFLTLYSAVEAYSRARHGHKDFKKLREYADVPVEVTGCTNDALALIGVSRNYYAHLGHTGKKYTLEDVENNAMESTRRLAALMQACLMRELGISPTETAELLNRHYLSWPIS